MPGLRKGIAWGKMNKRDSSIELLRVVASIFVIAIHVSGTYDVMMHSGTLEPSYLLAFMLNLTDCGVSVFLVISGAFLISSDRYSSFETFYKHSAVTIAIPTAIFSFYYVVYSIVPSLIKGDYAGITYEIKEALVGRPFFHMWYLYTLLCIHFFIPAIIRLRRMVGESTFERIAIVMFILSAVSDYTSTHILQYDPGSAFRYIGYLFGGYVAYRRSRKSTARGLASLAVTIVFLLAGSVGRYCSYAGIDVPYVAVLCCKTLLVVCPVLIFYSFVHFEIKTDITKFSHLCFYIYLIHAGVLDVITRAASILKGKDWLWTLLPAALNILAITAVVFVISTVLAVVYDLVQKKVELRWHIRQRVYRVIRRAFVGVFRI